MSVRTCFYSYVRNYFINNFQGLAADLGNCQKHGLISWYKYNCMSFSALCISSKFCDYMYSSSWVIKCFSNIYN